MTDDELEAEVRDLLRFRFAATAEDVADALGIDVELAARVGRTAPATDSPLLPGAHERRARG